MKIPTVGIDLGAEYTKITYRPKFPKKEEMIFVEQDSYVISLDSEMLIPSIVIQTFDSKRPWLCGKEAAGVTPAANWEVYRNWKSEVFSKNFSKNKNTLTEVAITFFSWLLKKIEPLPVSIGTKTRIRVSIPKLNNTCEQKIFLADCMKKGGWTGEIEFVEEPIANAAGTFSGGKNYITGLGKISYRAMFGNHTADELNFMFNKIKEYRVDRTRSEPTLKIGIMDFGGFTTDVAILKLDLDVTEYSGLPFEALTSRSKDIGVVKQIDNIVFKELLRDHGITQNSIPFESLELAKLDLYSDKSHILLIGSQIIRLGDSKNEKLIISKALEKYCETIWQDVSDLNWNGTEYVILTGGGANIRQVVKQFKSKFKKIGIRDILCLTDNFLGESDATNFGVHMPYEYKSSFGRVATALGDSSIAFGFDK